MKHNLIIATLLLSCIGLHAQDQFHPGFQFGLKGGAGYTIGETSDVSKLLSPAASVNFGYQFTPCFALRADISGWQGKGYVYNNDWKFNYAQLAADCVFDIRGFSGYKSRVFNPYFFVGAGGLDRFNNEAVENILPEDNKYWEGSQFDYVLRGGIGADFNLSDLVAIQLELVENATSDFFNSKTGDIFDHQINLLLGLKFNFGQHKGNLNDATAAAAAAAHEAELAAARKAKEEADLAAKKAAEEAERAAKAKAEADALAAKVAAQEQVYQPTPEELKAQAAEKAIKASDIDSNNVYFKIGSSVIPSAQKPVIASMVEILKSDPDAKVILCGFADKNTGNSDLNMDLSQQREQAVLEALMKEGISADRITGYWYGDTVQVSDVAAMNRVCVMISE